ncbi:MAG: ATP-binding protein [Pseudomonadota bacterium]
MKYLIFMSALLGGLLLYLLSSASANTDLFSRNYYGLLLLAGALAFCLTLLVGYQLWQLRGKIKAQVFGAKLTLRLALFFTLIAVLPGLLVYAVSVQFLSKSIESWFDVRVEKALEGGLNLGRSTLENGLRELGEKGHFVAQLLTERPIQQYARTLSQMTDRGAAQEAALFTAEGRLITYASSTARPPLYIPDAAMLRDTQRHGLYSVIDTLPDNSLLLRVLVPFKASSSETRILQFVQPVPRQLTSDAGTVQEVYRDYQQLSLSRLGLKRLYGITLTLSLLIVLLSAVSAAFFISGRLSSPLAALAEGTRAVAQGDFSQQHPIKSNDELGALTGLFNQMTSQLSDAKIMSEQQQLQVENAKAYLESVLGHLSSGVMVVDEQFRLRSVNDSAAQILGASLPDMQALTLPEIASRFPLLKPFCSAVMQAVEEETGNTGEWQRQIERLSKNGNQMLLMRGTRLLTATERGYVVVFDDITYLLQAERQAAWGEVARRLAHEIKNPLTPIQLSAERLRHKLSTKLDENDALLLQRATETIVSQVAAMKNMVMGFADYARAPASKLVALDLHQLLHEVLGLYETGNPAITLQLNAAQAWVKGDATRLRQVIHNLLQNSQDALLQATDWDVAQPEIIVTTTDKDGVLTLSVRDNGNGFSAQLLQRAFEPYMTTKPKGTGLGLAIVKKIVEEHGGKITIENVSTGGTAVNIDLPLLIEVAYGN